MLTWNEAHETREKMKVTNDEKANAALHTFQHAARDLMAMRREIDEQLEIIKGIILQKMSYAQDVLWQIDSLGEQHPTLVTAE
jgi:hypothetical protein